MKFKRLIILMFVLITSIIISIQNVNASTEKIEIYFEVDGQRELTKSYLDSKYTSYPGYDPYVMVKVYAVSLTGNQERVTNIEFIIEENDILPRIMQNVTNGKYTSNTPSGPFGPTEGTWDASATTNNGNIYRATTQGDDAIISSTPVMISEIAMIYNPDTLNENQEINLTFDYFTWDGGLTNYSASDISLPSIIIGDPNSTPDASLSALNITGTTTSKVYPFNVSATEEEGKITQNITIEYQDSIGGLTIDPVFTKTSLGSSNYVKTESKASTNYQTGDTITITTTDGDATKIYEIQLTVSNASTDTGIELKLAQGDLGTITFNSEKNRYEIVTLFTENDIKILATTAYPYATLDKNEIRVTNIEQDVFRHIGDFNVTAENGSTTTNYPVYVKREKGSTDASIKIITNEHPQGLAPVGNVVTINYPHTKTSLSFQIAKNQTGQTIKYKEVGTTTYNDYTTGIISKSSLETGETYSYEVVVTPESQFADEIVTYIVNFVIEPSNDTSIKTGDIKVQESGLAAINLDITNLVYTVSNNSSEFVTLTIDPGSKREAKIGEGTYQSAQLIHQISVASLNYGTNNFILTIKAQDGTEKEYTIKIEKKSDQAELKSIVFRTDDGTVIANLDDFTFISSENKYTYSFDYGLFPSNLKLETKTSAKSIIKGTTTNQLITPLDFSGMYEVITTTSLEVTSENGAVVKNYTIQITRTAADSNNDISAINIGGSPFTQFQIGDSNVTYNKVIVEPVGGIDTLNFEVLLPTTSKATVKVGLTTFTKNETGRYSTNVPFVRGIEQNVTIEVTAQNGEKNTIIIPFVVATNDTTLKTLNIEGTDFVFDPAKLNNTITINYSFNSNVTITASPQNVESDVYIDGQVRVNDTYVKAIGSGTTTFKVWVESEAGTKGSEYVINIVRAQAKTDNNLESFVLKTNNGEIIDLGFLSSKTNYTITIDDREELWPLIYTAHVNEQNYAYIGTKGTTSLIDQQFNVSSGTISNLTIQVYSEGGVLKTYTISIKRANDVKTFESVTISGTGFVTQTFSADQFISGVLDIGNIAYNIDRLNVTFNMVDGSKSTIESIFIGNNQSGIWLFSKTGLIEEQFRVKSQAGNFGEYLKIRVNRQVAQTHKNLENLEVLVNGNNILLDFDPTTNTYTLRVDRQVSTVTILATVLSSDRSSVQTPFNLSDTSGLNHIYTYAYNLNDPAAQPSNVIDIVVKAEDGTSKTYKVTIWRKNVEIGIDNIEIKNGSTVIYSGDILSVPNLGEFDFQTNQLTFIVTPKDRFARVSFNGGTTLFADEDGLITYTHTLVVGTNQTITLRIQSDLLSTEYPIEAKSQNYHFTYTRNEASTLAELDSLEIIVGGTNLLDGVFDSSIIRYEGAYLRVDRTHMSVQIKAVGREFSTVTGLGIKEIKPGITNSYTVTVTSQSGTHSKEYTVYIVSKNDDHEINNIKVNSNDIGFIDSEFEYTLDNVLYTVSSLPIQVILNDTFANYYVNGVKNATSIPLVYGNNIIEIYGESEYGTKSGNTYRLNVYRNEPYKDTDISSLSITNISNGQNIVYKADGTNYLVELPDTSSISNVKVDIELKNTDKQVLESTFNLSNIALTYNGEGGLDQTITFKVNAEDNSTKTYQIRFVKNIILSSDNSLNNVSIKNQDNQVVTFPFDELLTNNSVVLNLPYSDKSLNIEITPTHNKAHVTPNKLNNVSLTVGENTFEFTITAEDGTVSAPYTITIHRQAASKDINLNNLTVTDPLNSGLYLLGLDTLSPKGLIFNPTTKTYNIKLDETYINEEIIINIVKGHIAQTITGPVNAPLTLNHGTNRYEIFIKAEDETVTQGKYTIIIEVLYKSNSLQSLTVDGKALTVQDINYFETEKESVTITPVLTYPAHGSYVIKDSLGQVVTNTANLNFDKNIFTIEIKNEYGEIIKTHTLEITRLKSSEKTLSNVSLIGSNGTNYITFDPLTLTYTVEVPQNVEHVTLNATIPAKATATGLGEYIINLDETITITFKVTAEDGSESEIYT
ncbi:MAG: cadherin-like beta sandwich domain-containing protein, partial [Bacteroidales bacterium]|nr:cadherin-like beta sandwich domain-containing protein [Bacteroidales bacterium]